MLALNFFTKTIHFEFRLPFPYNNREAFLTGEAFDLLFEKNCILVNTYSFHKNKSFREKYNLILDKNKKSNVILNLHYMAGREPPPLTLSRDQAPQGQ